MPHKYLSVASREIMWQCEILCVPCCSLFAVHSAITVVPCWKLEIQKYWPIKVDISVSVYYVFRHFTWLIHARIAEQASQPSIKLNERRRRRCSKCGCCRCWPSPCFRVYYYQDLPCCSLTDRAGFNLLPDSAGLFEVSSLCKSFYAVASPPGSVVLTAGS